MSLTRNKYIMPCLLDGFMEWAGIHPLAFHDMDLTNCIPDQRFPNRYQLCANIHQYPWQGNGLSIQVLAQKLSEAYSLAERFLDFSILPTFRKDELELPRYFKPEVLHAGYINTQTKFQTDKRCVKQWGQPITYQLDTAATLTQTDTDGDNFAEHVTIVFDLSATVVFEELLLDNVYVTHQNSNGDRYLTIPVSIVDYDSVNHQLTVEGFAWDFIEKNIVLNTSFTRARGLNACDNTIYITDVELWYQTVDETKADGYIVYQPKCTGDCDEERLPFCVKSVNAEKGLFQIVAFGEEDETTGVFTPFTNYLFTTPYCLNGVPTRLEIFYQSGCAGYDCQSGNCQLGCNTCPTVLEAIYKIASAILPMQLCSECTTLMNLVEYYQVDLAVRNSGPGGSISYNFGANTFNSTFNMSSRGAVEGFRTLSEMQSSDCGNFSTWSNHNI